MAYDPSLMAPVDVGGMISRGIEKGQKTREAQLAKGAMAALVQNPNNPRALAALAQVDPEAAMQFRQQQAELTKAQLAQHQDSIIKGAEIIRQFNPKDQASYSAALQAAQQAGIDVSQVPQQYNPQYVDGVVKLADAFKPQPNPVQDPGMVREFEVAKEKGLIDPSLSYMQYMQTARPGMSSPVTIPYNSTVTQGGGQPPPMTATGPNGQKVQLNPESGQWEPVGGQTQPASGGFPQ